MSLSDKSIIHLVPGKISQNGAFLPLLIAVSCPSPILLLGAAFTLKIVVTFGAAILHFILLPRHAGPPRAGMSKVRPAGQIRPPVKFYPARSLVMKHITLVYCYLASSINIIHLPTRDQQHFTQHNPQPARIHG